MQNKGKKDEQKKKVDNEEEIVFDMDDDAGNPAAKVKKLQAKLKECMAERQEYLNGWQRAKADLINAKQGESVRRTELMEHAREQLIMDLLPVLDSFDMAFANTVAWNAVDENWRKGVEHIHAQLMATLTEHRLAAFDPAGEPFDPARHDSAGSTATDDPTKDHTVADVLQKGYALNGSVIRPARVTIFTLQDK